jgi:hypothetical protein
LPDCGLHLRFDTYKNVYMDDYVLTAGDAKDIVNAAYARGYTAFDYFMRQGEQTVSWYRGPLVPMNYDKLPQKEELVTCTDELLRYDPETGLFDTTYAAAWQLGRLLALQNQAFAISLDRARRALRKQAETRLRSDEMIRFRTALGLPDHVPGRPQEKLPFLEDSLMERFSNGFGDDLIAAISK